MKIRPLWQLAEDYSYFSLVAANPAQVIAVFLMKAEINALLVPPKLANAVVGRDPMSPTPHQWDCPDFVERFSMLRKPRKSSIRN